MAKLEISNLKVKYGNREVISDLALSLKEGCFNVVIGPNGCGKTTLLKAITNLIPSHGKIIYNGNNLNHLDGKQRAQYIAYFSQLAMVNLDFNVYDTVLLGRYPYLKSRLGSYQENDHQMVSDALKQLDLWHLKDEKLAALSGGQLQRVLVACLIVQDPHIILVDEVTNFLDFKYQIEIIEYLKEYTLKNNRIILLIIHDLNLAMMYADYLYVMSEGDILIEGDVKSVFSNPKLKDIYDIEIIDWYAQVSEKWRVINNE